MNYEPRVRAESSLIAELRTLALARIHQQEVDPLAFAETLSRDGRLYLVVLEIETLKITLRKQQADVEAVRPRGGQSQSRRRARLKAQEAVVADLEAKAAQARATLATIAGDDAEIINRPAYLQGVADGTRKRVDSLENAIYNPLHPLPETD